MLGIFLFFLLPAFATGSRVSWIYNSFPSAKNGAQKKGAQCDMAPGLPGPSSGKSGLPESIGQRLRGGWGQQNEGIHGDVCSQLGDIDSENRERCVCGRGGG